MQTFGRKTGLVFILTIVLIGLNTGCFSSRRSSEFELSREDYAVSAEEDQRPTIYLTGTKPIDSVAGTALRSDIWKLDATRYPEEIQAFVRVFDEDGNFVTNLAAPHYRGPGDYRAVWTDLEEQLKLVDVFQERSVIDEFTVREFSDGDSIPYSISLVLDHGGSMGGAIQSLQDGARIFAELKRSYDRITLIKFSNKAEVSVAMTSDLAILRAALSDEGLQGYGQYTAIYDAALSGIEALKDEAPGNPRVLVLFTDGEDNFSEHAAEDVYRVAVENDVKIFPIGFGYTNDEILSALAEETGGKFYKAYSRGELAAIFQDLYLSLRNYYLVTYKPPEAPLLHEVDISLRVPNSGETISAFGVYDQTISKQLALDYQKLWRTTRGDSNSDSGAGRWPPAGDTFDIRNSIFFDRGSDTLRPQSFPMLLEIVEALQKRKRIRLEIQGHTDNTWLSAVSLDEIEALNQDLSERRARAVVRFMISEGIEPKRLSAVGKGMNRPIAKNDSEEGRAANRRVQFIVLRR